MSKKIKIAVLLVSLFVLSLYPLTLVTAEPSEPVDVVNHATRECAQIWTGDECQSCVPAEGWEVLDGTCPEGYTVLDQWAPNTCTFYPSPFCCQSRAEVGPGCASPASPGSRNPASIGLVLVFIAIAGVILAILYKKRITRHL